MLETKLMWYTPQEKIPTDNVDLENNIIWITKYGSTRFGYFSSRAWPHSDKWIFGEDYNSGHDLYDNTNEIILWAYINFPKQPVDK